jgi:hypothetical protein
VSVTGIAPGRGTPPLRSAQLARAARDCGQGEETPICRGGQREAHMLRYWSPIIVPAIFETAEYRRAVIMAGGSDPERADELVAATLERQRVLSRTAPPEVVALLHPERPLACRAISA